MGSGKRGCWLLLVLIVLLVPALLLSSSVVMTVSLGFCLGTPGTLEGASVGTERAGRLSLLPSVPSMPLHPSLVADENFEVKAGVELYVIRAGRSMLA